MAQKKKKVLTQSEERRREVLQGQAVDSDGSGRLGLHLLAPLQQDRQTLAVLLQSRVAASRRIIRAAEPALCGTGSEPQGVASYLDLMSIKIFNKFK